MGGEVVRPQIRLDLDQAAPADEPVGLADQELAAQLAGDRERLAGEEVRAEEAAAWPGQAPAAPWRRAAWWRRFSR
jgi:hypothetical protein